MPPTRPPACRRCWTSSRPSWRRRCSPIPPGPPGGPDSYERLAFLGDSVLGLAVTTHLLPAAGCRPLRPRAADQDPGPGGLRPRLPRGGRAARRAGPAARGRPARRGPGRRGAGQHRAGAGLGDRGGDRGLLPAVRLRGHGGRGGPGLHPGDRRGDRALGRLQVGAAGAPGPARRAGHLRGGARAGAAPRPDLHGDRQDRRRPRCQKGVGRSKKDAEQEAAQIALEALRK